MLDVAVLGLDVVGVQIGDGGDIRVRVLAMVALVVVVGQNLPVEVALLLPRVVEVVVVEVVVVEAGLLVDAVKVILPGYLGGLFGVEVDPDEAVTIDVHMDGGKVLVVKVGLDFALVVLGDDELEASRFVLDPVARVGDAVLVGGEEPFARED